MLRLIRFRDGSKELVDEEKFNQLIDDRVEFEVIDRKE